MDIKTFFDFIENKVTYRDGKVTYNCENIEETPLLDELFNDNIIYLEDYR